MLHLKRTTIRQQLEKPEYQSIQQVLVGELKAIDLVINEFVQLFDIHEDELEPGKKAVAVEEEERMEHDGKNQ